MSEYKKKVGILLGLVKPAEGAGESEGASDMDSPSITACEAILDAVKSGSPQALDEALRLWVQANEGTVGGVEDSEDPED